MLAERPVRDDVAPDPRLPADTVLWARLQSASGGLWGGCVYDAEAIARGARPGAGCSRVGLKPNSYPRASSAIATGPIPQQPPIARAPSRRQLSTSSGGKRSTPSPLQVYVSPSQTLPQFG